MKKVITVVALLSVSIIIIAGMIFFNGIYSVSADKYLMDYQLDESLASDIYSPGNINTKKLNVAGVYYGRMSRVNSEEEYDCIQGKEVDGLICQKSDDSIQYEKGDKVSFIGEDRGGTHFILEGFEGRVNILE